MWINIPFLCAPLRTIRLEDDPLLNFNQQQHLMWSTTHTVVFNLVCSFHNPNSKHSHHNPFTERNSDIADRGVVKVMVKEGFGLVILLAPWSVSSRLRHGVRFLPTSLETLSVSPLWICPDIPIQAGENLGSLSGFCTGQLSGKTWNFGWVLSGYYRRGKLGTDSLLSQIQSTFFIENKEADTNRLTSTPTLSLKLLQL